MTLSLEGRRYGLETDRQQHVHRLLHDYDPNLSLRRILPGDPVLQFNPTHRFGVWEDNVAPGQRNWAFTVPEYAVDARLLARVMENDMRHSGASERAARMEAFARATEASKLKAEIDRQEARREEMLFIGRTAAVKSEFRHKINGQTMIIGSGVEERSPRTIVKPNRRIARA